MGKIKHTPSQSQLYDKFSALCSRAEYAASNIYQKVIRAGGTTEMAESLTERLTDEGFLSAERYARAFVHDKFLFNHWGRQKIRAALRTKGITGPFVEDALNAIDPSEYSQVLRDLITARNRQLKSESPFSRRQKLLRFAAGRGFEADIAVSLLDEIEADSEE